MNKILQILIGLILLIVPIYAAMYGFWEVGYAALVFLKGGLVWALILIGITLLVLGINDLKE